MRISPAMRWGCACLALCTALTAIAGDDAETKKKADKLEEQRYQLMQSRMANIKVSSKEEGFPAKYAAKPVFRFGNPAQGIVSGALWKLDGAGRPRALMTTELYRKHFGEPRISYEHLSLTPTHFSIAGRDTEWSPEGCVLEFKPIPDAPAPGGTPDHRLTQMQALARRFEITQNGPSFALRLLTEPVDRYAPSTEERADGTMFLFMSGSNNPEVALFLESDGKEWKFGAGRLTAGHPVVISIDNKAACEMPLHKYGLHEPYTAVHFPIDIPGIAPDGSNIDP